MALRTMFVLNVEKYWITPWYESANADMARISLIVVIAKPAVTKKI